MDNLFLMFSKLIPAFVYPIGLVTLGLLIYWAFKLMGSGQAKVRVWGPEFLTLLSFISKSNGRKTQFAGITGLTRSTVPLELSLFLRNVVPAVWEK